MYHNTLFSHKNRTNFWGESIPSPNLRLRGDTPLHPHPSSAPYIHILATPYNPLIIVANCAKKLNMV